MPPGTGAFAPGTGAFAPGTGAFAPGTVSKALGPLALGLKAPRSAAAEQNARGALAATGALVFSPIFIRVFLETYHPTRMFVCGLVCILFIVFARHLAN
jgi:hypothetical protein